MNQIGVRAPSFSYINNIQKYNNVLNEAAKTYAMAFKDPVVKRVIMRSSKPELSASEKNALRKLQREARYEQRRKANIAADERYAKNERADKNLKLKEEAQNANIEKANKMLALKEKKQNTENQLTQADIALKNIERMQKGFKYASTFLPKVKQDNYDDWVNWVHEQKWAPPEVFKRPEEVQQMTPDEFELYKSSLATNMDPNIASKYAPDIKERRNIETGEMIRVNERNPVEVQEAEKAGFKPVGPRSTAFLKGEGKMAAEAFNTVMSDAKKARQSIATLKTMEGLLDRFNSGKMTNISKNIQQWGTSLGIPIDTTNLSAKEAFLAFANQLALQSRNLGEGMVLAGQMSDQDVKFLKDMNPQLVISKGGNKLIINIRKKLAKRKADAAKLAYDYKKQNNGYFDPLEFETYMQDHFASKNIFGVPNGAIKVGRDKKTGLPVYKYKDSFITPDI